MARTDDSSIEYNRAGDIVTGVEQALGLIGLLVDEGTSDDHFALAHDHLMAVLMSAETLLRGAQDAAMLLVDTAFDRRETATAEAAAALATLRVGLHQRGRGAGKLRLVTEKTTSFLVARGVLQREGAQDETEN